MKLPDLYLGTQKLLNPMQFAVGPLDALGVTVHYTADGTVTQTVDALKKAGLGYHVIIDRDGMVYQTTYLSQRVHHAGEASWLGKSPNRHHVAVAVSSWGVVGLKDKKYTTWAGREIPATEVARRKGNLGPGDYNWHAATGAQERALLMFLRWCVMKGISPDAVCGHDECATPKGRKADPGGVLSLTMAEVRNVLKSKPGS